jgi:hypothetical protein
MSKSLAGEFFKQARWLAFGVKKKPKRTYGDKIIVNYNFYGKKKKTRP